MSAIDNPAAWRGRKRLFLHVGTHKTGTTSIQVALTRMRRKLAARGVLYPETGAPAANPFAQHLLAWSVIRRPHYLPVFDPGEAGFGDEARAKLWEDLRDEIDDTEAHTVILSSEEFDVLARDEVQALGRELADYDVTPVIFLRNFADLLESSYRTSIAYGALRREFADYIHNQRIRLDYAQFVREWAEIAAHGQVIVFFYDDPSIRRGAVESFFRLIGFEPHQLDGQASMTLNESVPAFVCEIMKFLRMKGCEEEQVAAWLNHVRTLRFGARANRDFSFLSPAVRADLDERYAQELAVLRAIPAFAQMSRGDPGFVREGEPPTTISNVAIALLAFAQAAAESAAVVNEGEADHAPA